MNKKDFIQRILIRSLPKEDKIEAGILYAEKLWKALDARGYGNKAEHKPRAAVNYYNQLTVFQKPYFDRFWIAYGKVGHRNEAAMSWIKLDPDEKLSERIIATANKDRLKEHIGSRKHAQGWLSGYMFEDYAIDKPVSKPMTYDAGELKHAKDMLAMCKPSDTQMIKYWEDEITKITAHEDRS